MTSSKELNKYSAEQLDKLQFSFTANGNLKAATFIGIYKEFYKKTVKVVKGRKVKHGTSGECFWIGAYDNSLYGDPWGIYTTYRCGIKDENGEVYWTSCDNIEVIPNSKAV